MQKQTTLTAWIYQSALKHIVNEATAKLPSETGGILMGYWSIPYSEVVITHATGPGPEAEHWPGSYRPDNKWQREEAIRIYDNFQVEYLGDWHSHPYPSDYLSWSDRKTLRTISRYNNGMVSCPLMLILHGKDDWMATAWRFSPSLLTKFLPWGHIETMEIRIADETH